MSNFVFDSVFILKLDFLRKKRKQCFFCEMTLCGKSRSMLYKKQEKKNLMSEDIITSSSHCPLDRTAVTFFFLSFAGKLIWNCVKMSPVSSLSVFLIYIAMLTHSRVNFFSFGPNRLCYNTIIACMRNTFGFIIVIIGDYQSHRAWSKKTGFRLLCLWIIFGSIRGLV